MHDLFLSTPPGLEAIAALEAEQLDLHDIRAVSGGVECRGDLPAIFRANASMRTASRILLRLGIGPVAELRSLAASVRWSAWLSSTSTFAVEVIGGGHRPAPLERTVREAILQAVPGAQPSKGAEQTIQLRLMEGRPGANEGLAPETQEQGMQAASSRAGAPPSSARLRFAELSLDTSGLHLHMRGYRQETGAAPLRENLAAGILMLAGYDGSQPLLDPMCGSGTFLIEGALLARGLAPGLERSFACESWPSLPDALIEEERARLRLQDRGVPTAPILGSDRNAGALGVARRNAQRAGVFDSLELRRLDAAEVLPPEGSSPGILVANPPYGKRSGEREELPALYRRFGKALRENFPGWTAAILVADLGLGAALRLPEPRKIVLRNGGIPCTLFVSQL